MQSDMLGMGLRFAVLLMSISVHEAAHALSADRLGDPGARMSGRLSLNPLRHIDPVGTIVLPLLLLVAGAPVFGWAKPVPVNPYSFKDRRVGMMLTGLAGPASNLLFAASVGLVRRLSAGALLALGAVPTQEPSVLFDLLATAVELNVFLAVFNMIPIPPLDGSRIVPVFLPPPLARSWESLERYGLLLFIVLVFVAPSLAPGGFDPLGWVFAHIAQPLAGLLLTLSVG